MHEDYRIICEGACNPDLRQYDEAIASLLETEFLRPVPIVSTIAQWCRQLVHTDHIVVRDEVYHPQMGFVREVVCAVCGQHRKW